MNLCCFAQAASVDRPDVVRFVIKADVDIEVDHPNDDGVSAMMLAASFGHLHIVQYLLGLGAAINRQSNDGTTALMLAVQNNVPELVRFHETDMEVGARDRNGHVMP